MKKFLISLVMLICSSIAYAVPPSTTVSATVVDSDTTVWAGATWTVQFQVGPHQGNPAKYTIAGGPLSSSVTRQTGVANSSGVITFTVYKSTAVSPIGSSWNLNVCPNASAPCTTINFSTSTDTLDLSTTINAAIKAPRFIAAAGAYGYKDIEATLQLQPGSMYYNVGALCSSAAGLRIWNGSWSCVGGSGGGGSIGGTVSSPNIPYTSGADTLSDTAFQYYPTGVDPSTLCWSGQPCLQSIAMGEGMLSISPDQISIANPDDGTQSLIHDGGLVVKEFPDTGIVSLFGLTGGGATDSSNNEIFFNTTQGFQVNSGSDSSYAVTDHTGLTIGGATSGTAAIGVTATGGTLIVNSAGIETGTASNTDLAGVITASTGTAIYTFSGTYTSAPVCIVQDDTLISDLLTKTVTNTTLTVTVNTSATELVSYICHGRN